jgi:hypothetical protein
MVEEVVSRRTHCMPYSHRGRAMDQVEGILEHRCADGKIQENGDGQGLRQGTIYYRPERQGREKRGRGEFDDQSLYTDLNCKGFFLRQKLVPVKLLLCDFCVASY